MKHDITRYLYWVCLSMMTACSAQQEKSSCGVISTSIYFFDTSIEKFVYAPTYWPEHRIWFKDSVVVQEIAGIHSKIESDKIEKRWVSVEHFTYIDLSTKSFYNYTSFSDTARLIKKYSQPDSVVVDGGWNFYYPRSLAIKSYENLSDTVMDHVSFKRLRLTQKVNSKEEIGIGYLRCDKKGTMFQYDKDFSKKIGCPLVRLDETEGGNRTLLSRRIEFVSDKLTPEELQVFAAWEKNAKENPVKK